MLGAVLVLLAAVGNATASVLQRRAAADEPDEAEFTLGMLFDLIRRPAWVGGILSMIVGFLLQAAALTVGQIAVVQPLLIAELPLTLLLASFAFGVRLPVREWLAVGALAVGLAGFVFCLQPTGGDVTAAPLVRWLVAVGIGVVVTAVLVAAGVLQRGQRRAAWLGVATGTLFGVVAALVSGVGAAYAAGGVGGLLVAWQTWTVIVLGPTSFFLLQFALQAGTLDASQPGFTLTNPLVGVLWGVLVFSEVPRTGGWIAGELAGAVLVVGATLLLVRSPALGDDAGDEDRTAETPRSTTAG